MSINVALGDRPRFTDLERNVRHDLVTMSDRSWPNYEAHRTRLSVSFGENGPSSGQN